MTNLLLVVIALLLLLVAAKLAEISARHAALSKWLVEAMSPKKYAFSEDLAGGTTSPQTIVDQIGAVLTQLDNKVSQLNDKVSYFRSYVWEVQDPRHLDDIRRPPKSTRWNMEFRPTEDPRLYGLWMRERDLEESWGRDVVDPSP